MPSPKAGTITFDIGKAVGDVKSGKIEYRTDRTGIVHAALGKKSFDERALVENYQAVLEEILRAKPSSAKGRYLRSITIASTMSPGIKLDTTKVRDLMEDARRARGCVPSRAVPTSTARAPRQRPSGPQRLKPPPDRGRPVLELSLRLRPPLMRTQRSERR